MDAEGSNARSGRNRTHRPVAPYLFATVWLGIGLVVRMAFAGHLKEYSPFFPFHVVAMLVAWSSGLGPALYVIFGGLALGDYFFLPPLSSFGPHTWVESLQILFYLLTAGTGTVLIDLLRTNHEKLQATARELRARTEQLEAEVKERQRAQNELQAARDALAQHADELEDRVAERTSELQESMKSLESFCYSIAHNIRAPLRALEGFATVLIEDYSAVLDATGIEYARRIAAAAVRADELIQDLLAYGHLSHVELYCAAVDLDQVVNLSLEKLSEQIKSTSAQIEMVRPLGHVLAHPKILEEAVASLIENALKFTAPGIRPKVKIESEVIEETIRLLIRDNGIGIAPEYQERIFEMFTRLHVTDQYPGTGIGLALARKGVERMAGKIGVRAALGCGSSFWIELQKQPAKSAPIRRSEPDSTSVADAKPV